MRVSTRFVGLLAAGAISLGALAAPVVALASDFSDTQGHWAEESGVIDRVVEEGIMTGYNEGTFGPNKSLTRGELATILWRAAGEPEADAPDFPDVDYEEFYGDAIEWARSEGIVGGYDDGTFGPGDPVTREQLATILYRYQASLGGDTAGDADRVASYPDGANVLEYARDAVAWAVDQGIIGGDSVLSPGADATRAEAAKMILVFLDGGDPAHGFLTRTPIMGAATAGVEDMVAYFNDEGRSYPGDVYAALGASTIEQFCDILVAEAGAEGVDPAVVFAQVMVGTNGLGFGGSTLASQCNFAGLGVTEATPSGTDFSAYGPDAVRMGLRAQVQHLKAYASTDALVNECVDEGFDLVERGSAPQVEYLGSGNWTDAHGYAFKILEVIDAVRSVRPTAAEEPYSPVYNYQYYRDAYPEVAAALGNDRDALLQNFLTEGMRERRQGCAEFSVRSYYNRYEDLRQAFGTDWPSYYNHYIQYGKAEGRVATGCDSLVGSWQYHNIEWAGQPNNYYCGPTAGFIILRNAGALTSSRGDSLTIDNVASYMETNYYGYTSFNDRKFEQGMNDWLGSAVYETVSLPSYATVRDTVMRSYDNGYATAFDAHERRGGPHYNGHNNGTYSHIVVVDAYNKDTDEAIMVDPGAGTVWWGASQKFSHSLSEFVANYVSAPDWGYRDGIGMYGAR